MQQNWVTAPQASCFFEIKHQDLQHRVTRVIQLRESREEGTARHIPVVVKDLVSE